MPEETVIQNPPRTRKELRELHERLLRKIRAMSPKERFKTIVSAGIYTPDGQLAKEYGG